MGGFDFGAALTSLGRSLPAVGKSFDDSRRQKELDELEKKRIGAALSSLAQNAELNKQTLADKKYAAGRTAQADTETDQAKTKAKSAYQSWKDMENQTAQAKMIGGKAGLLKGGYAGPLNEEYKSKLGEFSAKSPIQRMNQFELPYYAAADAGIKNTYETATAEQKDETEAARLAKEMTFANQKSLQNERLENRRLANEEIARHNREMERLTGRKPARLPSKIGRLGQNLGNL
jgi:hypothetical protein